MSLDHARSSCGADGHSFTLLFDGKFLGRNDKFVRIVENVKFGLQRRDFLLHASDSSGSPETDPVLLENGRGGVTERAEGAGDGDRSYPQR